MRSLFTQSRQSLVEAWNAPPRGRLGRLKLYSRHPHAVPIITFFVLIAISGVAILSYHYLHRSAPPTPDTRIVIITHDKVKQVVPSREGTVGSLLNKLSIKLNEGDRVEPSLSSPIDQDQFRVNIYRAVPVTLTDSGQRTFLFSAATTPRSIAKQAGLTTYSEDYVSTEPASSFIKTGSLGKEVVIDRATAVAMNLYGAPVVMRTHTSTVRQLLAEKHITLQPQDQVKPSLDAPLSTPGIAVVRNGITTVTIQEDIAAPEKIVTDSTLAYGTTAVRQQGTPGKRAVTYQINTQNGNEVSRKVIQTTTVQEPVAQITVRGSNLSGIKGDMALAGIAPADYTYADYIISHESGWNPTAGNSSGAYGLCQALPGRKMSSAGSDWLTNPVTQLRWCHGYAIGHYGSWSRAYSFWQSHHYW